MRNDAVLGTAAHRIIGEEEVAISVVSLWELVLKHRKGKLVLPDGPLLPSLEQQGFTVLPIRPEHIESSRDIHLGHEDPFDLLLVAVARSERRILLTRNRAILSSALNWVQAA